ncbi:MAG: carotenoid biosynthesis protein, partial [Promethearchaeota archaeon]
LAYSCNYISEVIFQNRNYIFQAFIAGIMAVSFDLWIDPVIANSGSVSLYSNSEGMWVWETDPKDTILIFSIPYYNFLAWFLIVFFFLIIYRYLLNHEKIENHGKTKSALIFFGLLPIFAVIIAIILYLSVLLLIPFFGGVDIFPITLILKS